MAYNPSDPTIQAYLANGGTQQNVDAYFAGNPNASAGQIANDAAQYDAATSGGRYATANTPQAIAQHLSDEAQFGAGSGTIYDPWLQPTSWKGSDGQMKYTPGYGGGAHGEIVKLAGGPMPAGGPTMAPAGSAAMGYGSLGTLGTGGGGGAGATGGAGGYSLPDPTGSAAVLRNLQMGGAQGLQGLMNRDTTASRKAIQDALYAGQAEGINTAADRSRQAMLEGTFGRGVGSSSILVELAGRGEQEREDALARAQREAFTQAGSEDRADLASQLGIEQGAFGAGTTGLQGEANVALANLAREQAAAQFRDNLAFQGGQNDANRAQAASQFAGNQALNYAQLGQQGAQFGQNLAFQGSENALNRQQQTTMSEAQMQQALALLAQQQSFAGTQNQAQRDATAALQASSQNFQGGQNQAQRDAAAALQASSQDFSGGQNALTRDQQNQNLLLQLAGANDIASQNRIAAGIGAAGTGAGALLGPWLAKYINGLGTS